MTRIALSTKRLKLDDLVGGAPDVIANGTVELTSDPANEDVLGVAIETDGFQYESFYVPPFVAKLRAREEGLDIDSVVADYSGGELYLDGQVRYAGVTQIHARGEIPNVSDDPNFAQFVEGLEGDAEFDLDIRRTVRGEFETKGRIRFDDFEYGALRAHFLILEGRVWGDPLAPQVDLELDGAAVRVAGYPIGNGAVQLTGDRKSTPPTAHSRRPANDSPGSERESRPTTTSTDSTSIRSSSPSAIFRGAARSRTSPSMSSAESNSNAS